MRKRAGGAGIRLAERRDAAGIRAIYNHYVTDSTALFDMVPRTLDEQVQWIDEHSGGHPAVVADRDGAIVGFGSLSPFRSRPAYATTVEDSVYLLPGHQGVGIGRALLEELLRLAAAHGFHAVIARITGENERLDRPARGVRLRARGHGTGGRAQVRALARRRRDAAHALSPHGRIEKRETRREGGRTSRVGRVGFEPT